MSTHEHIYTCMYAHTHAGMEVGGRERGRKRGPQMNLTGSHLSMACGRVERREREETRVLANTAVPAGSTVLIS